MQARTRQWIRLAESFSIKLPEAFLQILEADPTQAPAWKFLSAEEAISLKAELDLRFDYPGREWKGVPFARSTVSEDVACFDLMTSRDREAMVIPVRDWHGPRWEFAGDIKTFNSWLQHDTKGHLT